MLGRVRHAARRFTGAVVHSSRAPRRLGVLSAAGLGVAAYVSWGPPAFADGSGVSVGSGRDGAKEDDDRPVPGALVTFVYEKKVTRVPVGTQVTATPAGTSPGETSTVYVQLGDKILHAVEAATPVTEDSEVTDVYYDFVNKRVATLFDLDPSVCIVEETSLYAVADHQLDQFQAFSKKEDAAPEGDDEEVGEVGARPPALPKAPNGMSWFDMSVFFKVDPGAVTHDYRAIKPKLTTVAIGEGRERFYESHTTFSLPSGADGDKAALPAPLPNQRVAHVRFLDDLRQGVVNNTLTWPQRQAFEKFLSIHTHLHASTVSHIAVDRRIPESLSYVYRTPSGEAKRVDMTLTKVVFGGAWAPPVTPFARAERRRRAPLPAALAGKDAPAKADAAPKEAKAPATAPAGMAWWPKPPNVAFTSLAANEHVNSTVHAALRENADSEVTLHAAREDALKRQDAAIRDGRLLSAYLTGFAYGYERGDGFFNERMTALENAAEASGDGDFKRFLTVLNSGTFVAGRAANAAIDRSRLGPESYLLDVLVGAASFRSVEEVEEAIPMVARGVQKNTQCAAGLKLLGDLQRGNYGDRWACHAALALLFPDHAAAAVVRDYMTMLEKDVPALFIDDDDHHKDSRSH